ncbi:MAG TPA: hemolysin family protein [Acidimicrobiales bacterium]|nr:hemolysin family protein [Acidimicrobiales bacterium]
MGVREGGAGSGNDRGGEAQAQFIADALVDLRDTVVGEIMTPRVDVVALSIPVTADDITRVIRESGHNCFPVYDDNLDDLIGVLFVNDLFRAGWKVQSGRLPAQPGNGAGVSAGEPVAVPDGADAVEPINAIEPVNQSIPDPVDISRRLRQPFLVPESRLVFDVLAEMRRQRRAFAVVVDEHGGVEGVLTVKDVLSALVGPIPDEFDPDDEPDVVRVDGSRWLVDGRMSVDDVSDRLGIDLPEGEYVTLGGFLFNGFGHIPNEGEVLTVDGWELRVAEMDKRRIAKVVARRVGVDNPDPEAGKVAGDTGSDRAPVG